MNIKTDKLYLDYPKSLNFKNAKVSPAQNWFFILTTGRTGSTILTKILNLHKDIYCGNEQNSLHLFSTILQSEVYIYQKPRLRYTYKNQKALNISGLRKLMEVWKETQTNKKIFGDKDWLYGEEYSGLIDKVFPKNKKILTTRNILDQLSSLYSQPWYKKLPKNKADRYKHIKDNIAERIDYNQKWSKRSDLVVPFENFADKNRTKETILGVLDMLGADKKGYPINQAIKMCTHKSSLNRWRNDEIIHTFLNELKARDSKLYRSLMKTI